MTDQQIQMNNAKPWYKQRIVELESQLADCAEHTDHAPHENCGCKLCTALKQLAKTKYQLAELERQLAFSEDIRHAEKRILLDEIEAHTKTKYQLAEASTVSSWQRITKKDRVLHEIAAALFSAGKTYCIDQLPAEVAVLKARAEAAEAQVKAATVCDHSWRIDTGGECPKCKQEAHND